MRRDNPLKHFAVAFGIALIGYIAVYHWIEHRRTRRGPWHVEFTTNSAGEASLVIHQPRLAITNVRLEFTGMTNTFAPQAWTFDRPRDVPWQLPFGKCVFMDTTFLPGTISMEMYGHEVELLPRVLVIDRAERAWQTNATIRLTPR